VTEEVRRGPCSGTVRIPGDASVAQQTLWGWIRVSRPMCRASLRSLRQSAASARFVPRIEEPVPRSELGLHVQTESAAGSGSRRSLPCPPADAPVTDRSRRATRHAFGGASMPGPDRTVLSTDGPEAARTCRSDRCGRSGCRAVRTTIEASYGDELVQKQRRAAPVGGNGCRHDSGGLGGIRSAAAGTSPTWSSVPHRLPAEHASRTSHRIRHVWREDMLLVAPSRTMTSPTRGTRHPPAESDARRRHPPRERGNVPHDRRPDRGHR
jgi:hypothetical protein